MDKTKFDFYFAGVLKPIGEGRYQLITPYGDGPWAVQPHESQELRVYIEPKETFRRAPIMPT